jgi:hypothetical protein
VLLPCSVAHGLVFITGNLLQLSTGCCVDRSMARSKAPLHRMHIWQLYLMNPVAAILLGGAQLYDLLLCCTGSTTATSSVAQMSGGVPA